MWNSWVFDSYSEVYEAKILLITCIFFFIVHLLVLNYVLMILRSQLCRSMNLVKLSSPMTVHHSLKAIMEGLAVFSSIIYSFIN